MTIVKRCVYPLRVVTRRVWGFLAPFAARAAGRVAVWAVRVACGVAVVAIRWAQNYQRGDWFWRINSGMSGSLHWLRLEGGLGCRDNAPGSSSGRACWELWLCRGGSTCPRGASNCISAGEMKSGGEGRDEGWGPAGPAEGVFLRVPPGERRLVVVLAEEPFNYGGHWWRGQMRPCTGEGCRLCAVGVGRQVRQVLEVWSCAAAGVQCWEFGMRVGKELRELLGPGDARG